MYFNRLNFQANQCKGAIPKACKKWDNRQESDFQKTISGCGEPENPVENTKIRTASSGGIVLTSLAGTEKIYDLISLELDLSGRKHLQIMLSFACNISLTHSSADISIRLLRQANVTVPVALFAVYRRTGEFSGSDAIQVTMHDSFVAQNNFCNYNVTLDIVGNQPEYGVISVTNSVLTAILL